MGFFGGSTGVIFISQGCEVVLLSGAPFFVVSSHQAKFCPREILLQLNVGI